MNSLFVLAKIILKLLKILTNFSEDYSKNPNSYKLSVLTNYKNLVIAQIRKPKINWKEKITIAEILAN